MAKRRSGKLEVINVKMSLPLGTLANVTAVRDAPAANELFSRSRFVISSDLYCMIGGQTVGEGPIEMGWAHDDYSVAEIAENRVADDANSNDKISQEQSRRQIRVIGMFSGLAAGEILNDGKDVRTRIKIRVDTGQGLALYAFNRSGATLTTGATVQVIGKLYCRPL